MGKKGKDAAPEVVEEHRTHDLVDSSNRKRDRTSRNLRVMASTVVVMAFNLLAMASNPRAMASTVVVMASNLLAMASNLRAMASTVVVMASNLLVMPSKLIGGKGMLHFCADRNCYIGDWVLAHGRV